MTDSLKDTILLTLASLALCVEVLVLLHLLRIIHLPAIRWGEFGGDGIEIGYVSSHSNSVRSRPATSLSWYPTVKGDRVRMDDTVVTGSDSWAQITMTGDVHGDLHLGSDTLIRFSESRSSDSHSPVLNLEIGEGSIQVKSSGKPLRVGLRHHEIEIKAGAEIEISRTPLAEHSEVRVTRGLIALKGESPGSSPIDIKKGEGLLDSPERKVARIQTELKMEPKWPSPDARIIARYPRERVDFSWSGEEGQALEIDTLPEFQSPQKWAVKGKNVQVELEPGRYYWRVRRDLSTSLPLQFTLFPAIHYRLTAPAAESTVKESTRVVLKWEPVAGADAYHVEVSSSADFKGSLIESNVTSTQTRLEPLPGGRYYWRVRARHPQLGDWPASLASSFDVKKKISAPRMKGGKVLKKTTGSLSPSTPFVPYPLRALAFIIDLVIPSVFAGEATVVLAVEWEQLAGATGYLLEISESRNFKTLLKRVDTKANSLNIELPSREKYYWRIAARDEDGELGEFSPPAEIDARSASSHVAGSLSSHVAGSLSSQIAHSPSSPAVPKSSPSRAVASASPPVPREEASLSDRLGKLLVPSTVGSDFPMSSMPSA